MFQTDKYSKFLGAIDGTVGGVEADLFKYFGIDDNADNFFPYYPSPYMADATKKDIEVLWMSDLLYNNETTRVLNGDLLFAIFSIVFVLFWIRVHTKSSFIAAMGMYMIFMSLPFSLVIYSGIYQIPYFDSLHSLVLFIVLGVGADDVFVLVDSWRQTEHMFPGDIKKGVNRRLVHKRLFHCYEVKPMADSIACYHSKMRLRPAVEYNFAAFYVHPRACYVLIFFFLTCFCLCISLSLL